MNTLFIVLTFISLNANAQLSRALDSARYNCLIKVDGKPDRTVTLAADSSALATGALVVAVTEKSPNDAVPVVTCSDQKDPTQTSSSKAMSKFNCRVSINARGAKLAPSEVIATQASSVEAAVTNVMLTSQAKGNFGANMYTECAGIDIRSSANSDSLNTYYCGGAAYIDEPYRIGRDYFEVKAKDMKSAVAAMTAAASVTKVDMGLGRGVCALTTDDIFTFEKVTRASPGHPDNMRRSAQ